VAEWEVAEWLAAGHTEVGLAQEEQAQLGWVAMLAIVASLRARIAQLAVSAAGAAAVRVLWPTWAVGRVITCRRLHTNMSAVAETLLDPVEISLA